MFLENKDYRNFRGVFCEVVFSGNGAASIASLILDSGSPRIIILDIGIFFRVSRV